jgi:hypothetical protein
VNSAPLACPSLANTQPCPFPFLSPPVPPSFSQADSHVGSAPLAVSVSRRSADVLAILVNIYGSKASVHHLHTFSFSFPLSLYFSSLLARLTSS